MFRVLEDKEMFLILCLKVLSPFYIFQLFSCTSWFADEYVTYASCIVFITVISVILTLREVRKVTLARRIRFRCQQLIAHLE